jgi:hypothetical protein
MRNPPPEPTGERHDPTPTTPGTALTKVRATDSPHRPFADPCEQFFLDSLMLRDSSGKKIQRHTNSFAIVRPQLVLDLVRLDAKLSMFVVECLEFGPQLRAKSIERWKDDILFHRHMRVERRDEEETFTDRVRRPVFVDSPVQLLAQRIETFMLGLDPPLFAAHLCSESGVS